MTCAESAERLAKTSPHSKQRVPVDVTADVGVDDVSGDVTIDVEVAMGVCILLICKVEELEARFIVIPPLEVAVRKLVGGREAGMIVLTAFW